jgi:hypothetical protein
MGSIKKALKPVTRVIDNIIPNEIKPALPYLAATFGAPYLAGSSLFAGKGILSALGQGALGRGVSASLINAATNAALGRKFNPVSAATSGIMAGGGFKLGESFPDSELAQSTAKFLSPGAAGDMTLGQVATATSAPITAGTMEAAFEEAEKANREYDDYVRQQEEAGAADIQSRRDYITRYMGMAGFDQAQIDDALSRYGYKTGGRVGFSSGGSGTLGDSMQDMKILIMKNQIIDAGGGGFGGKDLDDKTDDEIIEIYEGLFGQGKANGGRIGYRIGGGPVKSFIAKLLGSEPSEEVLNKMFEERRKEILSGMFDAEAGTGAYSMQQMQEANDMATKQAMQELEEFKERIGMGDDKSLDSVNIPYINPFKIFSNRKDNPPEGSVSDDMIDQIMEPRKEGRVKEAMGGRIYKADGGIMNLKMGGMPAEMDLRPGGFVPIGAKEKADDVPARLSKNEFVMTADAVRAAGGGSVNKGAKRMYDLMHKLEARV